MSDAIPAERQQRQFRPQTDGRAPYRGKTDRRTKPGERGPQRQNRDAPAVKEEKPILTDVQKRRQPAEMDLAYMLKAGCFIANTRVSAHMKPYMFDTSLLKSQSSHKKKKDSQIGTLESVFNMRSTWNQLNLAALYLASNIDWENQVLFVANSQKSSVGAATMARILGARCITGRYVPGSLTNPNQKTFCEPSIIICSSANEDARVIRETSKANCAVIAFCDATSNLSYIDICIPCNNTSRLSIALMYYLFTRQVLRHKGKIPYDSELDGVTIDHFVHRAQDPSESKADDQDQQGTDTERDSKSRNRASREAADAAKYEEQQTENMW